MVCNQQNCKVKESECGICETFLQLFAAHTKRSGEDEHLCAFKTPQSLEIVQILLRKITTAGLFFK